MMNKDQIKEVLTMTQLLEFYQVKKGKANNTYHCPVHDDKNPSLITNNDSGIATCLSGCFKGLDIFSFIMRMENIDFTKALIKSREIIGDTSSHVSSDNKTDSLKDNDTDKHKIIPKLALLKEKHIEFLSSRGIKNTEYIQQKFNLLSSFDYIATPLNISLDTYKFIPIKKTYKDSTGNINKLFSYVKGLNREGQNYSDNSIDSLEDTNVNLLIVAGEKDVWRVTDSLYTCLQTKTYSDKDREYLESIKVISNTSGEGNVPKSFFNAYKVTNIETITICYDNDKSGKIGSDLMLQESINFIKDPSKVDVLEFSKDQPNKYDLTDFLNEGNSFLDIFTKLEKKKIQLIGEEDQISNVFEKPTVLKTGYTDIDEHCPIHASENTIITGRTGKGKTLLSLNVINGILKNNPNAKVVVFSIELTKDAFTQKLMSAYYEYNYNLVKNKFYDREGNFNNSLSDKFKIDSTEYLRLYKDRLLIVDYLYTIQDIEDKLESLERDSHFKPNFILIDYVNILTSKGENQTDKHMTISSTIKRLSKMKSYHIMSLCQANRMTSENEDNFPTTNNLADSDQYGRDAYIVYSINSFPDSKEFKIKPTKNRNGSTNVTISLKWKPETGSLLFKKNLLK